jgi:hypothetical protein
MQQVPACIAPLLPRAHSPTPTSPPHRRCDTQARADAGPVRQARCSTSDDDAKGFEEAVDVVGTAIWCEPESDAAGFAESEPS